MESYKLLTKREASKGIEAIQKLLPAEMVRRRPRYSRERARQMGTAGRRGQDSKMLTPVTQEQLRMIDADLRTLEWTVERMEAWLRSRTRGGAARGPLGGRTIIRTEADGNRVHWALKAMAKRIASRKGKEVA